MAMEQWLTYNSGQAMCPQIITHIDGHTHTNLQQLIGSSGNISLPF